MVSYAYGLSILQPLSVCIHMYVRMYICVCQHQFFLPLIDEWMDDDNTNIINPPPPFFSHLILQGLKVTCTLFQVTFSPELNFNPLLVTLSPAESPFDRKKDLACERTHDRGVK